MVKRQPRRFPRMATTAQKILCVHTARRLTRRSSTPYPARVHSRATVVTLKAVHRCHLLTGTFTFTDSDTPSHLSRLLGIIVFRLLLFRSLFSFVLRVLGYHCKGSVRLHCSVLCNDYHEHLCARSCKYMWAIEKIKKKEVRQSRGRDEWRCKCSIMGLFSCFHTFVIQDVCWLAYDILRVSNCDAAVVAV